MKSRRTGNGPRRERQPPDPPVVVDDGKIEITFDAFGAAGPTAEVLVDVVGYTTDTRLKAIETALATKASTAAVAALPGSNIIAAGTISADGNKASDAAQLGSVTVSKVNTGRYTLNVPSPGCGKFPIVMLTLGYLETSGQIALGTGFCISNVATYTVNTSNSAGVATDKYWQFMAIANTSGLSAALTVDPAPTSECTVTGECDD